MDAAQQNGRRPPDTDHHVADLVDVHPVAETGNDEGSLFERLATTRLRSLNLVAPLTAEDMVVQPMADASPTKWHLAHTTWFFEQFVLIAHQPGYEVFDTTFNYCFNSYYESQGPRQPRLMRGVLTRPSLDRVIAYRHHVDAALQELSLSAAGNISAPLAELLELGINHEQQHQELLLTDVLALFAANPLRPSYFPHGQPPIPAIETAPIAWRAYDGGILRIGHADTGFCWDNERPDHEALVHPFRLADRLVTNAEWMDFIAAGGYATPALWLSDGWATVVRDGWNAPLYWELRDGSWWAMSLAGFHRVDPTAPVTHVSYFEADAYARWAGCRLPTEFEWEIAAADVPATPRMTAGQPADYERIALQQMYGVVWQWTQSAYLPYPGYRPAAGAIGEYNGKFMVGQHVLRGSSIATPPGHARKTYRNFFYPHQRWQFTGLRLAAEIT